MSQRPVAAVAGLLGGACWLVRPAMPDGPADAAAWAGLALLGGCLAVIGAGLVASGAGWLRVLVAVALPVLAWSVLEVVHQEHGGRTPVLDAVLGLVALAASAVVLVRALTARGPRRRATRRPTHGAHAR